VRSGISRGRVAVLLACTGVFVSTAAGQCRDKPAVHLLPTGIKLTIRTERMYAETTRPLTVFIELTNGSSGPIRFWEGLVVERNYAFCIKDDHGKEAPLTERARKFMTSEIGGSGVEISLAPGGSYRTKADVSKVYEITIPGKYMIEACWGMICSNRIDIAFIPPAMQ